MDNRPQQCAWRRYKEFCGLCVEVKKIQNLAGTICRNEIAILYSSDNEYAFKNQHQAGENVLS